MLAGLASVLVLFPLQQDESAAGRQGPLREGEWVRESTDAFPGAGPVDAQGQPTVWCVRIVDAVDRRPIAGALVQVPWHPREGVPETEVHYQCAGRADWDGWVRLPMPAVEGWRDYVFADAPGYAAKEYCDPGRTECTLQRGTSVPVQLIDYTGRPVPDARIELILGCGHVPAQRTVVADRQGRATLPDIWPSRHQDLFVTAPGCHLGAYRLSRTWRGGDPPVEIHVVPGITVQGRVVDAHGLPVAGVAVGPKGRARWTRTSLDGRFRLVGADHWDEVEFDPPPQLGFAKASFTAPPDGVERTLVLGQPVEVSAVEVQVRGERGEAAAEVRVALVRTADGLTATAVSDDDGKAKLSVPPGRYRVLGDGELGTWARAEGGIDVRRGAEATAALIIARNPTVRVDASRVHDTTLGITTATAYRELHPEAVDGQDVPVPKGERATFRISRWEDGELLVKFVEIPAAGAKVVLDRPGLTKLKARCVGPDGKPMPATLTVQREPGYFPWRRGDEEEPTAEAVTETRLIGTLTWVATPQDESLAPARGEVTLSGKAEVDLGTVVFGKRRGPDLRLELPPDLQDEGGSVSVSLVRSNGFLWSRIEDGVVAGGLSQVSEGDRLLIRLDAPGALPFSFRAPGPPPWTVKLPTGSLKVTLRSSAGKPLIKAVAILDGQVITDAFAEDGPLELRGVPAGAHTLVLAERDHTVKVFRLLSQEGEARSLDVTLTPRDK